jgi:glycosyltransferase involved in cell wall biosynthesis
MRILQLIHNHKFGGAEQHVRQLCEGLRNTGHSVEVAAPKSAWIGERLQEAGFRVHDFDFRGHYDVSSLFRLVALLHKHQFDLVHTHLVRAAWYGKIAVALTGTPIVSSVHDMATWKRYPRNHPLIAVSNAVKEHLISRRFEAGKISVIFPGAMNYNLGEKEAQTRKNVRHDLGLTESEVAVLMVGRVAEIKGHDIALESMRLLGQAEGPRFRLFCAGQETQWGRALRASAAGKYATWLGRRSDVADLLAAADIIIQPSRSEGLGIALMEAASVKKPMVASNVGGIPEIIKDQVTGRLIQPNDPMALAEAIKALAYDTDEATRLGQAAQDRFVEEYSVPTMIAKTLAVYESINA